jgi:excisionase family DNA binding protein
MPARIETLSHVTKTGHGTTSGPEPLLTASQVAAHLGVPTSWVYEKSALGIIPSIKVGVYRRFRWSVIEEWLEEVNA